MIPLQIWHLKRYCDKHGLDYAHVDLTLTYAENKAFLEALIPSFDIDLEEWKGREEEFQPEKPAKPKRRTVRPDVKQYRGKVAFLRLMFLRAKYTTRARPLQRKCNLYECSKAVAYANRYGYNAKLVEAKLCRICPQRKHILAD